MKKYESGLFTTIISLIIIIPLLLYLFKFGTFKLSDNFQDWELFSNYWTTFLSLAATLATAVVAYYASLISNLTLKFTKTAETPRITFEMISLGQKQDPVYIIKNAGKVPAVNCFLFLKQTGSVNEWDETVNCYTIKPDEVKIISWIKYLHKAEMHYQSFSGEAFTTTVDNQKGDFTPKDQPAHINIKNYSEVSIRNIEEEVVRLLNGSSENKEDMKMLTEFILNKARDCNSLYFKNEIKYENVHLNFFECINELIISIQVLDNMIEEIKTTYIKDRRQYFLKIFWIQLDVGVRSYFKKWHSGEFPEEPNEVFRNHLKTIHVNSEQLYKEY